MPSVARATPSAANVERVQYSLGSMPSGLGPREILYASAASGTLNGHKRPMVTVQASVPRRKVYSSKEATSACASFFIHSSSLIGSWERASCGMQNEE